ncbi:MAG: HIT domain-containing protein [Oligoflexales bacterium]|nr:HIT domain-containing protein [Oligoflexales bacterium]
MIKNENNLNCSLCPDFLRNQGIVIEENECCLYVEIPHEIMQGWGLILPKSHKQTLFELSPKEFSDTHQLLLYAKTRIDNLYKPQGYNVGWNVGKFGEQETMHAHLHVIPRFKDEPLAGKGIRHWFKQEFNRRKKDN